MDIKNLAYKYVLESSENNIYTIQTLANLKMLKELGEKKCFEILSIPVDEFCKQYDTDIRKDYLYKNDFLTPRNSYLINPLYYLYYTYLVFGIAEEYLNENNYLDFSTENLYVFYAGYFTKDKIAKNHTVYYDSYRNFQEKREEYLGQSALKVDIKDFFDSIKLRTLFQKLNRKLVNKEYLIELEKLLTYCRFEVLPQFNYSIASSILSQIYLQDFDEQINDNLPESLIYIRYVDDMYFINTLNEDIKEFNNWLNIIIHYLWKDDLHLNTTKTRILTADDYQEHIKLPDNDYGGNQSNSRFVKLIDDKSTNVIRNGDFLDMLMELCSIEEEFGIDMKKYELVITEYLSIDGDYTNKVLRDIIYTQKWEEMGFYDMKKIYNNWKFILFNPLHFTVLYIMIKNYLYDRSSKNEYKVKEIIDYLISNESLTFRDLIIGVTYLLQNEFKENEILLKIKESDPDFTDFIYKYIL